MIDMVIIGHISKDRILVDHQIQEAVGGAVYFAAFAARPAGINLLVITKLSIRNYDVLVPFWKHGIPVLSIPCRSTTIMVDSFTESGGYERVSRIVSVAAPFRRSDLPIPTAGIYYLGGLMRGEIPDRLIEELSIGGKIALDLQGILRVRRGNSLVLRDWRKKKRYLPFVDFLKADLQESRLITGEIQPEKIIAKIHDWGVKEILITDTDGLIVSDGEHQRTGVFQSYSIESRTGRGDTCFASYLSHRLNHNLEDSLEYCLKITNLKLQRPGAYFD
jgi:sugar/nucleoside kinase (ribokinase family)